MKILRINLSPSMPSMICRYCSHWYQAKRGGFQDNDEDSESEKQIRRSTVGARLCHEAGVDVLEKDLVCERFSLYWNFWCDHCDQCYDIDICIARQQKNYPDCYRCRQGGLIWSYVKFKAITDLRKEMNNE